MRAASSTDGNNDGHTDGSTDGSHLVPRQVFAARLVYLSFNCFFIVLNFLMAYAVYTRTNSLTMRVDFLSFGCEVLAVIINICIELVKRSAPSHKTVLTFDLVGGLSSLQLLAAVGLYGLYNAVATTKDLVGGYNEPPAGHLEEMVEYSAFSLCLSVLNLSLFAWLKGRMLPEGGDVRDQLNLLSNLAHSVVDFITNFAVLGTSLWLHYVVEQDQRFEMRRHKVVVDVFGSFTVCAVIFVSICWLLRDVARCLQWIRETQAAEAALEGSLIKAAAEGSSLNAGAPSDYGTLQGVGPKVGGAAPLEP